MIVFNKCKIRWFAITIKLIGVCIFIFSLALLAAGILKIIPGPYTDVKLYPKIFTNGENYISEMEHFPREIPENAEEVEKRISFYERNYTTISKYTAKYGLFRKRRN